MLMATRKRGVRPASMKRTRGPGRGRNAPVAFKPDGAEPDSRPMELGVSGRARQAVVHTSDQQKRHFLSLVLAGLASVLACVNFLSLAQAVRARAICSRR